MWIGCLGPLTAFLMVFDGSKQILNSSLACWIVMSLHQAFGSDFRYIFPSHFILSNFSLILACFVSGCLWIVSWTRVTSGSKLKVKAPPPPPPKLQPVCISGNALRTHSSVIVAGWDRNGMFGCEKIKHVWCKYRFRWQRDVSGVWGLGWLLAAVLRL